MTETKEGKRFSELNLTQSKAYSEVTELRLYRSSSDAMRADSSLAPALRQCL